MSLGAFAGGMSNALDAGIARKERRDVQAALGLGPEVDFTGTVPDATVAPEVLTPVAGAAVPGVVRPQARGSARPDPLRPRSRPTDLAPAQVSTGPQTRPESLGPARPQARGIDRLRQGLDSILGEGPETRRLREMEAARAAAAAAYPQSSGYTGTRPRSWRDGGGTGPTGQYSNEGPSYSGDQSGIYGLLAQHEGAGDPNTLFGHSQRDGGPFAGVRLSDMTVGEVIEFTRPNGEYAQWVKDQIGRVATPTGIGQIVGTTLRNSYEAAGVDLNDRYDAGTQQRLIEHLARQRLERAGGPGAAARRQLRAEWEGFKHVSDQDLDAAINQFMGWA